MTITDQAFGSIGTYNRYHGALGTGINLTFVKEVDVKTTAFEPAYGKATGGIVQIVTKSGGDQFHGAVSAYFAPSPFYAEPLSVLSVRLSSRRRPRARSRSRRYDAAIEVGGYIRLKDKLFFFGAWDPSLTQNYITANPNAPAASVALGHDPLQHDGDELGGQADLEGDNRTTIEATAFGDPSRHNAVPNSLSSRCRQRTDELLELWLGGSAFVVDSALTNTWTCGCGVRLQPQPLQRVPG